MPGDTPLTLENRMVVSGIQAQLVGEPGLAVQGWIKDIALDEGDVQREPQDLAQQVFTVGHGNGGSQLG